MQQFFSLLSWSLFTAQHVSGLPARPRTQHDCHHGTKVKPEAATAVIELLMMGGKTPETCWAVNKRQDNKLKNCCIRLVIYLNCTVMMHGLTNLKKIPFSTKQFPRQVTTRTRNCMDVCIILSFQEAAVNTECLHNSLRLSKFWDV